MKTKKKQAENLIEIKTKFKTIITMMHPCHLVSVQAHDDSNRSQHNVTKLSAPSVE